MPAKLRIWSPFCVGFLCLLQSAPVVIAQEAIPQDSEQVYVDPIIELLDSGDVSQAVTAVERSWEGQYEDYFAADLADVTLAADEIAATLARLSAQTSQPTAPIYAIPKPQQLELILLLPGGTPKRFTVDVAAEQLRGAARNLGRSTQYPSNDDYLEPAQQLYDWLVRPLADELVTAEIDTLMFCLGGGLRSLPLGVLHDGNRFLVERFSHARIPGFNLMQTSYTPLQKALVLAMGASQFATEVPLPAVPVEIEAVASTRLDRTFLNSGFTIRTLQQELGFIPYRIVHLATHARFESGTASESYVQFWNERLTLDRLREIPWGDASVELLVLSACQTAIGDRDAELGIARLALQAGVNTAIASLWSVSDTGTLALMSEFYAQLQQAPTKSEALRRAQLALLQGQVRVERGELRGSTCGLELPPELAELGGEFSHPFYWAAFTAIGSPW
ncbi:CHAT domain-containing protein [Rubidibacter lacunae]|uniref:CHAT domain-containing protein n=1 Tax=Rubidibacter lacunae TaxID=582514 RepID=UPI0004247406|nr:CHAT domain-containing protein [Rubidibacter lacunae]